ncbi:alpha-ketoglutarate transporter [Burkholderia sp. WAC0059]|uniref:MFS transporter n=1 Tax=Burkholderia sp. WAC0059 TaxID=2066022 RepID=UPI000C7F0130|nr:MFS transporter [Burkholderia sp. WAC0059]PLZ02892.1 alpha-ketoglutarate transporter [Burkholderia sp. WAC0059]
MNDLHATAGAAGAAAGERAVSPARRATRSIVGGSIGNLIEWYDFHVYTTFSVYFAASFFPRENRTIQLLSTAAVFALGFLLRPIGSWLIGLYADRRGRRAGLTLSVVLMCGGSLAIGLCPAYAQIGLAAPFVLLLSRLVQGFSLGGEYGASSVYLSEIAKPGHRGFYTSFHYVTLILGQLLATLVQVVLQELVFSRAQLDAWGWRVPFLIGAALALVAWWVRRNIDETPDFRHLSETAKRGVGLGELRHHKRAVALVFGITTGGTLAFFTYTVYMHSYLVNTVGLNPERAAWVSLSTLTLFMVVQPLFGAISDLVGRRPLLIAFGVGGTFGTWPLLAALAHTRSETAAFVLLSAALLIVCGYTSVCSLAKAELFPTRLRALGVGVPYSIATALFGGTAGYAGLWFKSIGHEAGFYLYASACIACTLVAALCLRRGDSKMPA